MATFIDFCSGIGGGRLAFDNLGLRCLGFSEINKNAEKTYRAFFGRDEVNFGDVTKIVPHELPDFDLMVAGFPCQTFSDMGKRAGFNDTRGQIIFSLIDILKAKNCKGFLLENVKGLVYHDKGRSLNIILQSLEDAGYKVHWKVLNSINYGVPQMRERVYLVGFRDDVDFTFPTPSDPTPNVKDFLIDDWPLVGKEYQTFLSYLNNNKYQVEQLLDNEYLVIDTRQSDMRLYYNRVPTLRTDRHGILYVRDRELKKLSGLESLLLQGFPKELAMKVTGSGLRDQAGNAMTVSTIQAIGREIMGKGFVG